MDDARTIVANTIGHLILTNAELTARCQTLTAQLDEAQKKLAELEKDADAGMADRTAANP